MTKTSAEAGSDFPGIIYTEKKPGKWKEKVGGHAPKVSVEGKKITIATKHPMTEKHYIVRHTLVDEHGKVIGEKTFYPTDKEAVSTYELPDGFKGGLYATSFCNLHDLWVTKIDV
ncbi:MAG: desulfoferrodoxin family protein [Thermodesulfovibrionales bacterium]|nr:desulfoferrodoxin family protein [Thermodesulfovibrionales bacterium]